MTDRAVARLNRAVSEFAAVHGEGSVTVPVGKGPPGERTPEGATLFTEEATDCA
jgi:hypothetical protein